MKISCGTCRNIKMPERRSLMKYTKEDILRIADEENVSFIRLQFTDILGSLKNVAITRSQLEKRSTTSACLTALRLRASCV